MKKILNAIFAFIDGENRSNWFSRRFHRWKGGRIAKFNHEYRRSKAQYQEFYVTGAGFIRISEDMHTRCGEAVGFDFGVEWGKYGFTGGTLGRYQARRMAEFLLEKCNGAVETEQEEIKRRENQRWQLRDKVENSKILTLSQYQEIKPLLTEFGETFPSNPLRFWGTKLTRLFAIYTSITSEYQSPACRPCVVKVLKFLSMKALQYEESVK